MSLLYYLLSLAASKFESNSAVMSHSFYLVFIISFIFVPSADGQQYDQLISLKDHTARVYFSKGHEQRALSVADRVDKAIDFHGELLEFRPSVTLLVLSTADWSKYTSFPVYGMPHYNDDKTLIVAAEDNPFWKSFIPPLEQLPKELREQVQKVYRRNDGSLSMEAFFDLLALHELGHAFHFQAGLTTHRKWMGELYANILLHTYIAEKEPEQLAALTLFPQMVINGGTKEYTYTSLKDIEERYDEIGQRYPKNYGWYQSRWHAAAAVIYDNEGKQICRTLWDAMKSKSEILADEQLILFFEKAGAVTVADMMRYWERDMIK